MNPTISEAHFDELIAAAPLAPKPTNLGGPGPAPAPRMEATEAHSARLPSSLSPGELATARLRAAYAAYTGYKLGGETYTEESPARWDGIDNRRNPWSNDYLRAPHTADCSAYCTWALWIATRDWKLADFASDEEWKAGYTGTLTQRGVSARLSHLERGSLVFYGGTLSIPQHVAMYVGKGRVISMGQQGDPKLYPVDLYGALPIVQARAYLVK